MNRNRVVLVGVLLFFFAVTDGYAQDVEWKDRGDRYEGVRGRLKKAQLELLSAAVLEKEDLPCGEASEEETPAVTEYGSGNVNLKFYLADGKPVDITIREFIRHHYWMKPKPLEEWQAKGWHPFSWPGDEVLAELKPEPPLYELGAVARIGGERSRDLAPIVLYLDKYPSQITAYRFIFRPPDSADVVKLRWTWYKISEGTSEKLGGYTSSKERLPAGEPFCIDWKCTRDGTPLPEGWYRLSIRGWLEYPDRDENLREVYRLYHKPVLEVPQ
jgi:hypothetical protein